MGKKLSYRKKASIERVRELFTYEPETGEFYWTDKCAKNVKPGGLAGFRDKCGYWGITIDYVIYKAHRVAWAYVYGEWPDLDIDHIDGQRGNNSIKNLRLATNHQNQANRKTAFGKSKYKGVCFHKMNKKWMAQLKKDGETEFIGYFSTQEDAAIAYNKRAILRHGEFAALNTIAEPEPESTPFTREVEKSFDAYMNEVIKWKGKTGKRSVIWSKPRCDIAREVWLDCMHKQNESLSDKHPIPQEQSSS